MQAKVHDDTEDFNRLLRRKLMISFEEFDRNFTHFQSVTHSKFSRNRSARVQGGLDKPLVYKRLQFACVNYKKTNCPAAFSYQGKDGYVKFTSVNMNHNHDRLDLNQGIIKYHMDLFYRKCRSNVRGS